MCYEEGEKGQCANGICGFCKKHGGRCLFAQEPDQERIDRELEEKRKDNRRRWGLSILRR